MTTVARTATATDELLGAKEAAQVLGVSSTRVRALRAAGRFPAPDARLACGPVWLRSTLDARCATRPRRQPGSDNREES